MNGKTAKLLRKVATLDRAPLRPFKAAWNRLPRNKRHAQRQALIQTVLDASPLAD